MRELLGYYDQTLAALRDGTRPEAPGTLLDGLAGIPLDVPSRPAVEAAPGRLAIALCCREYPPETAFGGMATFTYHLAHGLADAGHRVAVISAGTPGTAVDHDGRVDVIRVQPRWATTVLSAEALHRRGWLAYAPTVFVHGLGVLRALQALEAAHGPFDVLDLADHAAEGLVPMLFHPGPTTARLYSPYAVLAAMRADLASADEARPFDVLEGALLRGVDVITSPSRDLAARTTTYFDLRDPVATVPNPVDVDRFHPVPRRGRRVRVCFVGRLEERKGIRTLLAAVPRVLAHARNVEFEIVGRDVQGVARGAFDHRHRDRVRFRDPVPLDELPSVYQGADLAVVPSLYDNSPYTCIEPMACGIPVVGTTAGGIAEYVVDGVTGLIVAPGDPDALVEAILRLVDDPGTREAMGRAGRARVEQLFHYRAVAAAMEQQYAAAMRDGAHAAGRPDEPVGTPATGGLNRARPELNRVEAVIPAGLDDGQGLEQTLASTQDQGVEVTVVWDGPLLARFPDARTVASTGDPGLDAARVLPTVLTECFMVLEPGMVLTPGLVDRALCSLAASGRRAVCLDGIQVVTADAARGVRLATAASWAEARARVVAGEHPTVTRSTGTTDAVGATPPAVGAVHRVLWGQRLRRGRDAVRRALLGLPGGIHAVRTLQRLGPHDIGSAGPYRPARSALVVASRAEAARLPPGEEADVWVLEDLGPETSASFVWSYLHRTRPGRVFAPANRAAR